MSKTYKNNFLKEVILRIDFLNTIVSFNNEIPTTIVDSISKNFPIPEQRDKITKEIKFEMRKDELEQKTTPYKEWVFYDKNRENHVIFSMNNFILVYKSYFSSKDFHDNFVNIIKSLFDYEHDLKVSRFGLRYINHLELPGRNPFSWTSYLNKNMLSNFKVVNNKNTISQVITSLSLNYDNFFLRFQYGMHNPDFPAPIKKRIFLLDFDAYKGGIQMKEDIIENFPIFHDEIKQLFENAITDNLRDFLDGK